ncbi:hypothetical protein EC991_005815 [Linnemannia zychae]|nr:hypothetical protein EC991_005815 [Linnemannia zychae]
MLNDILNNQVHNYGADIPTPNIAASASQAQERRQNQAQHRCSDHLSALSDVHNQNFDNFSSTSTTTPLEGGSQDLCTNMEIANVGNAAWTNVTSVNQDYVLQVPVLPSHTQALDLSTPPASIFPFEQIGMPFFMNNPILGVQGRLGFTSSVPNSDSGDNIVGAGALGTYTAGPGSLSQQPMLPCRYPVQQQPLSHGTFAANDFEMVQQHQQQQAASFIPLAAPLSSAIEHYDLKNQDSVYQQQQDMIQGLSVQAQFQSQSQYYSPANTTASSTSHSTSIFGQNDYHPSVTWMVNPYAGVAIPDASSGQFSYNEASALHSYPLPGGPVTLLPMDSGPSQYCQNQHHQAIMQQQELQRLKAISHRRFNLGQDMSIQDQVAVASMEMGKVHSKLRMKKQEEYRQAAFTSRAENSSDSSSEQQYNMPNAQGTRSQAPINQGFHQQAVDSPSSLAISTFPSAGSQALNSKRMESNSHGRVTLSHTQSLMEGNPNATHTITNINQKMQQRFDCHNEEQQQLLGLNQQQQQLTMDFNQQLHELNNALHQQMQQLSDDIDQQLKQQQQQQQEKIDICTPAFVSIPTPASTILQPTTVASGSGSGFPSTPVPNPTISTTTTTTTIAQTSASINPSTSSVSPSSAHPTKPLHHPMLNELSIHPQDGFETKTTWATNLYSIYGSIPPRPTGDYYRVDAQPKPFFGTATPTADFVLSAARLDDAQTRISLGPMATSHPSIVNRRLLLRDEVEEQDVVIKTENPEDTVLSINARPRLAQQSQHLWDGVELPVAGTSNSGASAAGFFRAQLADNAAAALAAQNGEYSTSNGRPPNSLVIPPILSTIPTIAAAATNRRRNRATARPAATITAAAGGPLSCSLPHCPRTFPTIGLLKSHMVSHNDQKPYWCDTCSIDGIHPRPISPSQLHPGLPVPVPEVKRYKRHHDLLRHKREQHPPVEVKVQRYNEKLAAKEERKKRAEEGRKQKALMKRLTQGSGARRRRKAGGTRICASSSRLCRTSSSAGASSRPASSNDTASTPGMSDHTTPGDSSTSDATAAFGALSFRSEAGSSSQGSSRVMTTLPQQTSHRAQRAHSDNNNNASASSTSSMDCVTVTEADTAAGVSRYPRKRCSADLQRISEEDSAEIIQECQDSRPKKAFRSGTSATTSDQRRSNATAQAHQQNSPVEQFVPTSALLLEGLNEYTHADVDEQNDSPPSSPDAYRSNTTSQEWDSDEFEQNERGY